MRRRRTLRLLLLALAVTPAVPALAVCGDAIIDAGESCDDGGTTGGDGCSAACRIEPADRYKCYRAKGEALAVPPELAIEDDFGPTTVMVVKPVSFCTPVDRDGLGIRDQRTSLVCYKVRGGDFAPTTLALSDPLTAPPLDLTRRKLLCVPSRPVGEDYALGRVLEDSAAGAFGGAMATIGSDLLIGGLDDRVVRLDATGAVVRTYDKPVGASPGFGAAVAALGTNVVVGAPDSTGPGEAYVFDGDTGALVHTLTNPTPDAGDAFGFAVAGVGGNVVVGAPSDDTAALSAGAVHVFDGGTGTLVQTIVNPDPRQVVPNPLDGDLKTDLILFGVRLATLGSDVLIGTRDAFAGDNGVSEVFLYTPATGTLLHTFFGHLNRIRTGPNTPPDTNPLADDRFGWDIAVSPAGTDILIGAERADVRSVSQAGAAYAIDPVTRAERLFLPDPQPATTHRFGNRVGFVGQNLLVGDTGAGQRARLYTPDGVLLRRFTEPEGCTDCPILGWGERIVISVPPIGKVYIYTDTCADGAVDPGEECDDGNTDAGDGCAPDCRLEPLQQVACYRAVPPAFAPVPVALSDQFETKSASALRPSSACAPVDDGSGVRDAGAYFACYDVKDDPGQPRLAKQSVVVRNRFGEARLAIRKGRTLCEPATAP